MVGRPATNAEGAWKSSREKEPQQKKWHVQATARALLLYHGHLELTLLAEGKGNRMKGMVGHALSHEEI